MLEGLTLKEIIHLPNEPHTSTIIPMLISDPVSIGLKLFFAQDVGYEHGRVLINSFPILAELQYILLN